MTQDIAALIELSEKATQGEWSIYDSNSWRRFGLVGDYREFLYPAKAMDGHADMGGTNRDNDLNFIISIVNWFRANAARLAEIEKDAEKWQRGVRDSEPGQAFELLCKERADGAKAGIGGTGYEHSDEELAAIAHALSAAEADVRAKLQESQNAAPFSHAEVTKQAAAAPEIEVIPRMLPKENASGYEFDIVGLKRTDAQSVVIRTATPSENLRIMRARFSEHLSPAEDRELEEAASLLEKLGVQRERK